MQWGRAEAIAAGTSACTYQTIRQTIQTFRSIIYSPHCGHWEATNDGEYATSGRSCGRRARGTRSPHGSDIVLWRLSTHPDLDRRADVLLDSRAFVVCGSPLYCPRPRPHHPLHHRRSNNLPKMPAHPEILWAQRSSESDEKKVRQSRFASLCICCAIQVRGTDLHMPQ